MEHKFAMFPLSLRLNSTHFRCFFTYCKFPFIGNISRASDKTISFLVLYSFIFFRHKNRCGKSDKRITVTVAVRIHIESMDQSFENETMNDRQSVILMDIAWS